VVRILWGVSFKGFGHEADNIREDARRRAMRGPEDPPTEIMEGTVQRSRAEVGLVEVREVYGRLCESISRVVVGKDEVVELALISLLTGGTYC
jgi:hypothetical protein